MSFSFFVLGFTILITFVFKGFSDHLKLLNVVSTHVVSSPLFELSKLTSFDAACTLTIHDGSLV